MLWQGVEETIEKALASGRSEKVKEKFCKIDPATICERTNRAECSQGQDKTRRRKRGHRQRKHRARDVRWLSTFSTIRCRHRHRGRIHGQEGRMDCKAAKEECSDYEVWQSLVPAERRHGERRRRRAAISQLHFVQHNNFDKEVRRKRPNQLQLQVRTRKGLFPSIRQRQHGDRRDTKARGDRGLWHDSC